MPMPNTTTLFAPEAVADLFSKVKGHSSLAVLSNSEPVPFTGKTVFTFSMDNELDIVAENGAKSHGGATMEPISIVPIKFEYGARVSDEFMTATDEKKIEILKSYNEGFSKKAAKALDIAAMHGINPRTGQASTVVGTNHFDAKVTQTVTYTAADPDANIEAAIALVDGAEGEVNGLAASPAFRQALAQMTDSNGNKIYPELKWGAQPKDVNGLPTDFNKTVSTHTTSGDTDHAIIGDFQNAFRWGFSEEIPLKVIEYGDPDNTGKDLAGHNQVYLRSEVFLGWGILDANSFARVKA